MKPGGFPFPLTIGTEESRYLTWVRNHSNYMAERGFLDYMRIVAILVRGILINFLTLLPYLLVGSLLLGVAYNPMLDNWDSQGEALRAGGETGTDWIFPTRALTENESGGETAWERFWLGVGGWAWWLPDFFERIGLPRTVAPYLLTPIVALAALVYYLLFPVVIRLFKVISHKKSLETGSGSSVKLRDKYERSFGGGLIAILGMLALETLPLLIHNFHQFSEHDWRGTIAGAVGGGAVVALSTAGKLIKLLGGLLRKFAMVFVGLLGLVLPLIVILYVGEFLIYDSETFTTNFGVLMVVPTLLGAGIIAALLLGLGRGALDSIGWLLRMLLGVAAVVAALWALDTYGILLGGWLFIGAMALEIWLFNTLAVDVNLTSVHGLYRDRLASAYLVGEDTQGDVDIEEDIDLHDIALYETFSTAPYHLINTAHNLQNSKDIGVRERNSDFFVFSKLFVGGQRTGYCRSETLEKVFPQMDLATAMAISAAAAAPNMGANTSRAMVALLTLLNVRLGYWIPNPKSLQDSIGEGSEIDFNEVFDEELRQVESRWRNLAAGSEAREEITSRAPNPAHGLIGLAFSGGGIRSATLNLGIVAALHRAGVFDQVDYMSTVSGGGYLGSSLSTLMRSGARLHSAIDGDVEVAEGGGAKVVTITGADGATHEHRFRDDVELSDEVTAGQVEKGQSLVKHRISRGGLGDRFAWRVRPVALLREMMSRLDETYGWVNLSDGGHLENLGVIELLRRRCRFIIAGDGEADPNLHFTSLATLIRYARIDLGIRIDIDPSEIRLELPTGPPWPVADVEPDLRSRGHLAVGRIRYPKADGEGYEKVEGRLLYLKSSFTGDEDEVIQQYRSSNPTFPHESTADQFFDEGQFEAYRSLGQHITEKALAHAPGSSPAHSRLVEGWLEGGERTVAGFFERWFEALEKALPNDWSDTGAQPKTGFGVAKHDSAPS